MKRVVVDAEQIPNPPETPDPVLDSSTQPRKVTGTSIPNRTVESSHREDNLLMGSPKSKKGSKSYLTQSFYNLKRRKKKT